MSKSTFLAEASGLEQNDVVVRSAVENALARETQLERRCPESVHLDAPAT
jgi:hypothetical protein